MKIAIYLRYFTSLRTWRTFATHSLVSFGAAAAVLSTAAAIAPEPTKEHGTIYISATIIVVVVYSMFRVWPTFQYTKHLGLPNTKITLTIGNLFDQEGHLVIGMSDTFDTEPPVVISENSIQGQFLKNIYNGDLAKLDYELGGELDKIEASVVEDRRSKALGKLRRFPIGTTVVLDGGERLFFCLAYARMNNQCMVETSIDVIWESLASLWNMVRARGDLGTVSMAVVGSGLARLTNQLSHSDLIKLAFISFLIASRQQVVARELRIVVHPKDAAEIDVRALFDFIAVQ